MLADGSKSTDAQNVDKTGEHPPPKRPAAAWLYFNTEFVKEFVAAGGERKLAFTASSAKWGTMSEAERAPYNAKADAAKAVVEAQKTELKRKGFYTLEDGSKSTDP